jgi:hypothetical protein
MRRFAPDVRKISQVNIPNILIITELVIEYLYLIMLALI